MCIFLAPPLPGEAASRAQGIRHRHLLRPAGVRRTPKPRNGVPGEQYAQLVAHALDRAGVTKCVVVRHSMGGQFAVELAAHGVPLLAARARQGRMLELLGNHVVQQSAPVRVADAIRSFVTDPLAVGYSP